ncbi:translation initiation factor IF-2-like [Vulpes lagopus]|uniref:translation initiation factor IF-2-like n=1 Tax=Vulpes lagopus TaxID=494514 RepID=UPI001BC9FD16|nr:translation initiation factor IF-2-like [Vulpes lagopus]
MGGGELQPARPLAAPRLRPRADPGASAPPHPAHPSLAGPGAAGGVPATAEPRRPRGGGGEGGRGYSPADAARGRLRGRGGAGARSDAARLLGGCPSRGPRWSLAAPGRSPSAGRCPGNGRAPVASLAAPVYYCGLKLFPVWRSGRKEKKKKNPGWGQGEWAAESQRAAARTGGGRAAAVTCSLETPRVPGSSLGQDTQLIAALLWGVGSDWGGSHAPPSGGARTVAAGTSEPPAGASNPRPLPCSGDLPPSLLSARGQRGFDVPPSCPSSARLPDPPGLCAGEHFAALPLQDPGGMVVGPDCSFRAARSA